MQHTATHCNTLQHTATHCNTPQHTAQRCNALHHAVPHCNSLQLPATHCNTLQQALLEKRSVVVSAPTGSGKTVCGEAAVYLGVAMGKRTFFYFCAFSLLDLFM